MTTTRFPSGPSSRAERDTETRIGRPPYPVGAIANFMIGRAKRRHVRITNLKLQKLVYIAYGSGLVLLKGRLFEEPILAWKFGPVIPAIYHEFKRFGSRNITQWSHDYSCVDRKFEYPVVPDSDRRTLVVLNLTWDRYGRRPAEALVGLTHQQGTPWSRTPRGEVIDDELIRRCFLILLRREALIIRARARKAREADGRA